MKEGALERLDAVAEKLGVVSEHLWMVATRQGMAEGVSGLVIAAVLLLICGAAWTIVFRNFDAASEFADEGPALKCILSMVVGLGTGIVGLAQLHSSLILALNPEGYALKLILEAMK